MNYELSAEELAWIAEHPPQTEPIEVCVENCVGYDTLVFGMDVGFSFLDEDTLERVVTLCDEGESLNDFLGRKSKELLESYFHSLNLGGQDNAKD